MVVMHVPRPLAALIHLILLFSSHSEVYALPATVTGSAPASNSSTVLTSATAANRTKTTLVHTPAVLTNTASGSLNTSMLYTTANLTSLWSWSHTYGTSSSWLARSSTNQAQDILTNISISKWSMPSSVNLGQHHPISAAKSHLFSYDSHRTYGTSSSWLARSSNNRAQDSSINASTSTWSTPLVNFGRYPSVGATKSLSLSYATYGTSSSWLARSSANHAQHVFTNKSTSTSTMPSSVSLRQYYPTGATKFDLFSIFLGNGIRRSRVLGTAASTTQIIDTGVRSMLAINNSINTPSFSSANLSSASLPSTEFTIFSSSRISLDSSSSLLPKATDVEGFLRTITKASPTVPKSTVASTSSRNSSSTYRESPASTPMTKDAISIYASASLTSIISSSLNHTSSSQMHTRAATSKEHPHRKGNRLINLPQSQYLASLHSAQERSRSSHRAAAVSSYSSSSVAAAAHQGHPKSQEEVILYSILSAAGGLASIFLNVKWTRKKIYHMKDLKATGKGVEGIAGLLRKASKLPGGSISPFEWEDFSTVANYIVKKQAKDVYKNKKGLLTKKQVQEVKEILVSPCHLQSKKQWFDVR